ncbi:MAG: hypothetical protein COC05_03230 [Gammaproteobacteria bacterium]|nr:MAG: hypothetical protein COC05_03230 [Gammaproteobacteria bacterium]
MTEYMQSLPDGWTIYLWMVAAGGIIIAAIFGLRWAYKNEQFDEDIKYVVFDDNDKDKMSKEDFAKAQEVNAAQEKRRTEVLAEQKAARQAKQGL